MSALLALGALLAAGSPALGADRSFTKRFGTTANGDLRIVGNTSMSCSALALGCTAARAGTASGTGNNNNSFSMQYVDVDSDSATFNSSRADLTLPSGATVLFAGLYWGGESTASDALRRTVRLDTPAVGGYAGVTGSTLDTGTATPAAYQAFADVTLQVSAGGSGTYAVANVQGTPGSTNQYAGWALVVAYAQAASPRQNLAVFDGFQSVSSGSLAVPVSGLTTPASGTVAASVGIVAYEGDRGTTGDSVQLGSTTLSDALNPVDNALNSTIGRRAVRFSAKLPDHVNQLGFDADVLAADGILTPGSTSATLTFTSTADLIRPGVLTFVTDSETDPPETTITAGASGATSDTTPTFAFSSDEPGSTFECRLDGGAWAPCTSPHTTAPLGDGSHTFEVRATDAAGNTDPTPAARAFAVDTDAPQTTLDSGPSGPTNDAAPSFVFSSDEPDATFECRVDGGAWAACSSPATTAALSDGQHTFDVRATDAAGNTDPSPASRTFTVDTGDPETTIESGPDGPTGDATPSFAFSSDEPGASFECRVDGGGWAPCTSSHTTASLADGPHTLAVRATDAAGNTDPSPASRTFIVDTSAPDASIDSGPAGSVNDPTPSFTFSADEPGASFECRMDGGAWATCTSPHTTTSLGDGSHTFEVRAIDAAGNVDTTPAARTFGVDTAVPETTIDGGPSGPTNDSTPSFTFSSDEPGVRFECRIDGDGWAPCTSPETTPPLPDGQHTFEVRAVDPAGNPDAAPASRTFTIDTDDPQTTIDSGPSGPTNDPTPTFAFSADEPGASFECRIDGGDWGSCSSPHTTAPLSDGPHTLDVRAVDAAGNADATPAARTFTVVTTAPGTTIDSGPVGPTTDPTPTFTFSADAAGSTFECRVDGGPWAACSSPETLPSLSDGPHTFEVRATDPAGNVDGTPASRSYTVDTETPQTAIESGPTGPTNAVTPSFAFSSDESGAAFECRIDGGPWTPCTSPEATAALGDGEHTFEVRAVDAAGNADPTPASRTFTVDTNEPQTTLESGPSGPTSDATPTFAFSSDEPGTTFECRLDDGAWSSCSSPETTEALDDGEHTFEVRAIDAALNIDATPASRTLRVDTDEPETTIDSGPTGPINDATPGFTFSSDEGGASFECSIDDGAWSACSSPETTAALDDGEHTIEVRATDPAGNTDPTPALRTFTVDTDDPQTTIDSGPTGVTSDPTPTFAFSSDESSSSFECRIDEGAWTPCSSPETTAVLGDGPHTFDVRATDAAGNADPTPAVRTFTVDSDDPQTTIDSGPSDPTNNAAPTFAFSADEPGATFECRVDGGAWTSCTSPETLPALASGPHTFEVRAADAAGNVDPTPASRTFTLDAAAPETTIDSGPSGPTSDTTPTFTFSSGEPGSSFECRIDGGAWAQCTSPETLTALDDGQHAFEVRAVDAAGNIDPTPASRVFTVDTDGPQTTIDSGPTGATNHATPEFAFSSNEPGAAFECRVDGGDWASCTSPHTTATLGAGEHTFEVRATDTAGNVDPTPASRTFTIDTDEPQTTIDSGPAGLTGDATPEFAFRAGEPAASFECRVDGGAWSSCTSPHTTAALPDGSHTFEVRATDLAGNTDATPASRTFTVDTEAPQTTIDSGPAGPTNDPTPSFAFSSDAPGAVFECRFDGGPWTVCTSPHTTATLDDGEHTFEVRATDAAGNADPAPASRTFTVDTEDPQTTIESGPSGPTADATPTFAFGSDEPGSTFECHVDDGPWAPCTSPQTTAGLGDGDHTFEVRATDAAGNTDASPAVRTFTVNSGEPETTIDSGPAGPTSDASPAFAFSSDEPGSSYECRVDGGAWAACLSPVTLPALTDGPHSFEVRATDPAANVDASPASRSFTVDTTAPQTAIDSGPAGPTSDPTPTFGFGSSEPGTRYECRIDGGDWVACTSPHTTAPLADGAHTLEVRAIDAVGNVDGTPAVRTFTVATGAPAPPQTPAEPADPGDLGVLPGSLVGGESCQRLAAGVGTRRLRVRGIGRVYVRLRANAIVLADDPLRVTVKGARANRGTLRSVRYRLDGRWLRASRRAPFTLAITPASLAGVGRHVLTLRMKPRNGRARTHSIRLRTLACRTIFRAHQYRALTGTRLRLRIDSRDAVSAVTFRVPGRLLPKPAARRGAGRLRVVAAATGLRSWRLAFGRRARFGPLVTSSPAPRVTLARRTVTVAELQPETGIVEVTLRTRRSTRPRARLAPGDAVRLRAAIMGTAPQRLSFELRGRRR